VLQIIRGLSFSSVVSLIAVVVSVIAVGVSAAAAFFAYQQNSIGERNTFWSNVTRAELDQKNLETKLLYNLKQNGNRVSSLINDLTNKNGVVCSELNTNYDLAKPVLDGLSSSSQQILASYLTSILGNEQLGSALDISGWSSMVHGWGSVAEYWTGVSLTAGQLQIDTAAYERKCSSAIAGNRSVPADTSIDYKELKRLPRDLEVASNLPNNKLYQALILANMPSVKP
jgi:hypothetical protein